MFTQNNTTGYTDEQLAALNRELDARLDDVLEGPDAQDERHEIEKAFSYEVAGC